MKIGQNLGNSNNANTGGEKTVYLPLNAGEYLVSLTRLEEKENKAKTGSYLDTTFRVMEGESEGRLIFHKFILESASAKAAEIGQDQLNKFLKTAGIRGGLAGIDFDSERVSEVLNLNVTAKIAIEPGSNGYKDRNKITSFASR